LSARREESEERRGLVRRLGCAAVTVGVVLLTVVTVAAMSGCCEHLFYYPDAREYSTPAERGLAFEPVQFASGDGTGLTGWFIPAAGEARGTVIHCHGNAQNMSSHWLFAEFLPRRHFNLLVFDYRGYGKSEGTPSRRGTIEDARAALEYVLGRRDVDPGRVGLFGQSIGGAVAVVVAAGDQRVRGLVIDSAFSSYRAEAAHALRSNPVTWLPAWPLSRVLIRSGLDPIDHIQAISPRPTLVIHGTADRVVPCEMGRELAEKAGEPKELWLVDGAGHTASMHARPAEYERKVCDFFEKAFAD